MTIETVIPQILEHVDISRWARPAEIIQVVAARGNECRPAPMSPGLFKELGRDRHQAAYDHRVMLRLWKRDGVLLRWESHGSRPDLWAVSPDLEHWRHVPWLTPRRRVVSFFAFAVAQSRARARESAGLGLVEEVNPPKMGPPAAAALVDLSVADHQTRAGHYLSRAQPPGETPVESPLSRPESGGPHYAFRSTTYFSHSLEPREGESDEVQKAGEALLKAVSRTVRTPLIGSVAERIRVVGRQHAGELDQLLAHVPGLAGLRTGTGVALALEGLAATTVATGPAVDAGERIKNLHILIASAEAAEAEPEYIEKLRSELTDLGGI